MFIETNKLYQLFKQQIYERIFLKLRLCYDNAVFLMI